MFACDLFFTIPNCFCVVCVCLCALKAHVYCVNYSSVIAHVQLYICSAPVCWCLSRMTAGVTLLILHNIFTVYIYGISYECIPLCNWFENN